MLINLVWFILHFVAAITANAKLVRSAKDCSCGFVSFDVTEKEKHAEIKVYCIQSLILTFELRDCLLRAGR